MLGPRLEISEDSQLVGGSNFSVLGNLGQFSWVVLVLLAALGALPACGDGDERVQTDTQGVVLTYAMAEDLSSDDGLHYFIANPGESRPTQTRPATVADATSTTTTTPARPTTGTVRGRNGVATTNAATSARAADSELT